MLRELLRTRRLMIGLAMILAAILIGSIQNCFEGMFTGGRNYVPVYSSSSRQNYQRYGQRAERDDLTERIDRQIDRVIETIDEFINK